MTREEANQHLVDLGFEFQDTDLIDSPEARKRFSALQKLMAGFALDQAGIGNHPTDRQLLGMEENAQEWLVG